MVNLFSRRRLSKSALAPGQSQAGIGVSAPPDLALCMRQSESLIDRAASHMDPNDDMVLELAVAAGCNYIVTYNLRDFQGAEQFGIRVVTAKEFLQDIGELS